jgi:hypothetical protein
MPDEKLSRELNAADAIGKQRFGEEQWASAVDAIGKAVGAAGVPEQAMREILAQPDPAGVIMTVAKQAGVHRDVAGARR